MRAPNSEQNQLPGNIGDGIIMAATVKMQKNASKMCVLFILF